MSLAKAVERLLKTPIDPRYVEGDRTKQGTCLVDRAALMDLAKELSRTTEVHEQLKSGE